MCVGSFYEWVSITTYLARSPAGQVGGHDPAPIDPATGVFIAATFMLAVLLFVFACLMWTGSSWARFALCFTTGVSLYFPFVMIISEVFELVLVGLGLVVLSAGATILMFLPDANRRFNQAKPMSMPSTRAAA
jgi:hypothetical protein